MLAVEVLQYVPIEDALDALWRYTAPGGRLVAMVPMLTAGMCNKRCSLRRPLPGRHRGTPDCCTISTAVQGNLGDKGLVFREDKRLWPY